MKLLIILCLTLFPMVAPAQALPIEVNGKTVFKNEISTTYSKADAYDKIKKWLGTLSRDLGKILVTDNRKKGLLVVKHSDYSRRDTSKTVLVTYTLTIKITDLKVVSEVKDFYSIFFEENNEKTEALEDSRQIFVQYANGQGVNQFTKEEFDDRRNIVFKVDMIQSDLYLGLRNALK